ncbi:MAG: DUF4139 domain-containing protein [Planctomycetota bacterium]|jgi:hypothetical protein
MNRHLTEQELIEHQFKLASETEIEEIDGHLAQCWQCRNSLDRLKRKFSALDLLREEVEISEDLISQTAEQARQPARRRLALLRRPAWIASAAAVLLAGSLLLVSEMSREKVEPPQPAAVEPEVAEAPDLDVEWESVKADDASAQPATDLEGYAKPGTALLSTQVVSDDQAISEEPPFAPASAIELVTLPRRDNVQITIYNSADLTLVRERRNLTLKTGWNWLQFMWANTLIDPTSLQLEPLEQKDKIDIQQLVFPARLRELGRWLIRSEVGGQVPFEITYFTSGLSWRAFYMGTLSADEQKMRLKGYVRVGNNSGEDYEGAQTRLIVGKIHLLDEIAELARREHPHGRPGAIRRDTDSQWQGAVGKDVILDHFKLAEADEDLRLSRKDIKKEGLSEYFLYTIEGTETIPDKWGKRLLSFEADDIAVKSLYKYDEDRYGNQAVRFLAFANDEEHNLGETPIPDGQVKVYSLADEQGYLSYVGGTSTKYIPVDEEVELNLGPARLVKVEPTMMDFKTGNYVFDPNKNIAGWDEIRTWKIEVTNTRILPVEIEITRGFGTAYWSLVLVDPASTAAEAIGYEKHDVTRARFKVAIQPRSKRSFGYTVTTYHGRRQELINE